MFEKLTAVIKNIGDKHGINIAQTQIAWAIAKGVLPIVGVTKIYHVEDAAKAVSVMLAEEEISLMEKTADELGLSTIRFWEKKMERTE